MSDITSKITNGSAIDSGTAAGKTIAPGLRADVMRKLMETKNTLSQKGSIYVGTGNKETITVGGDTCEVYETEALAPGDAGSFLLSSGAGIHYSKNLIYDFQRKELEVGNILSSGTVSATTVSATTVSATTVSASGAVQGSSFNATSDERLKENIVDYRCDGSILDLPVHKYDFIGGKKGQIGCLAQDLQRICPEIVDEDDKGYLSIQESKIVYLLLDEVKRLRAEVDELKGK